ncbi:MAG TPA: family 20 glycosylhydrolase [Candidatus Hydrogenedentes bacterium]|nr:family 20 glycosylhydrolase [Candidatus Hydrogenedentota bacterium]HOR49859.1 family 20 glycosylhydrolase [Candidatus Hydrogenedentota bacterium]HPK23968.1 family 20 glycosylhydrolase [Candidatus Hydrogenedentota bacterium]
MKYYLQSVLSVSVLVFLSACSTLPEEEEEVFVMRTETTRIPVDINATAVVKDRKPPEPGSLVLLPQPRLIRSLNGSNLSPAKEPAVRFDAKTLKQQGYTLDISEKDITIIAADEPGLFYARQTLAQIQRLYAGSGRIPCLHIEDWPDFPNRGVLLDIARDKVPTMQTLYEYVDLLAHLKFNQLQLYTEHSFAYPGHEVVWKNASPVTPDEIRELDRYCAARYIELVPNQNSFGHMERWLAHPEYSSLAEIPGRSDLCPTNPGSIALLKSMYDSLLPCFSSSQVNVGCDETFTLGEGASKAEAERLGKGRVYLNFLAQIYDLVQGHGKKMQFWGDIILNHPELIPELPKNIIAMEWGYEAKHPFDERCAQFARSGIPFYVCPGTSSWNSLLGRTDNALANLERAARNGLNQGAIGYLITDWGDSGHWQFPPVSYLPFAQGAALSWAYDANRSLDLVKAADLHIFEDASGLLARSAFDLGNAYLQTGTSRDNAAVYYGWLLYAPEGDPKSGFFSGITAQGIEKAASAIQSALERLAKSDPRRKDGTLIKKEFTLNARLALLSLSIGKARLENNCATSGLPAQQRQEFSRVLDSILADYEQLWLARNRSGGLSDSLEKMKRLAKLLEQ